MSMSPENYIGLEAKSMDLLYDIQNILAYTGPDMDRKAAFVYEKIVALESELNIAIKNLKSIDKIKKYQNYLDSISFKKDKIYFIAHII
ncbi:hypothetical protein [Clostridium scatologenes]|uniref:Uncharacterized protein n=1 Tax=Clostridium scatologenes TaxID=1548 RepID=A0A0E3MC74_CLOSL|nr:hypothetical protein [Clostridium scatologenes]AKA72365.1 hypothetical protein CSCA_5240 [Clostridium scatologenes]